MKKYFILRKLTNGYTTWKTFPSEYQGKVLDAYMRGLDDRRNAYPARIQATGEIAAELKAQALLRIGSEKK